jgi:hypothetical protein
MASICSGFTCPRKLANMAAAGSPGISRGKKKLSVSDAQAARR